MKTTYMKHKVVLASTPEQKTIHYRIRYQVYCLEKGFEPPEKFTNAMEIDDYDQDAVHFIVKCLRTGEWIGAFRILIDQPSKLPMSKMVVLDQNEQVRGESHIAEFSRLAILRPFQNLQGKDRQDLAADEPEVLEHMVLAGFQYARHQGLNKIVYICKRSLARVLGKFGIKTIGIGSAILHRGVRYPYMTELEFLDKKNENLYSDMMENAGDFDIVAYPNEMVQEAA
jgi:N-acyl amino acid synthase of PEP-CTERM/exosortase system